MAVRPRRHPADVWREATETQNKKKRSPICDVLTGIPASKATVGSEGKLRARGSLPQRHTLTHTHLKDHTSVFACFSLFITAVRFTKKCFRFLNVVSHFPGVLQVPLNRCILKSVADLYERGQSSK